MKNYFKIIISLTVIFAFTSTLILCCAFVEALASTLFHCDHDQAEHGHDQSEKADHEHDSHSSHDCMCQKAFIADFSKFFNTGLASFHLLKRFLNDDMVPGFSFNSVLLSQATLLSDRSPPLLASASIPIYLKISNLRL